MILKEYNIFIGDKKNIGRHDASKILNNIKTHISDELKKHKNYISDSLTGDIYDEISRSSRMPIIGKLRKAYLEDYFNAATEFKFIDNNMNDPEIYKLKLKESGVTPLHLYAISAQTDNDIKYVLQHPKSASLDMRANKWNGNTPAHLLALSFSGDRRQIVSDLLSRNHNAFKVKNNDGEVPVGLYVKRIIGDEAILGRLSHIEKARYLENIMRMPFTKQIKIKYGDEEYDLSTFCNDFLELSKIVASEYEYGDYEFTRAERQINKIISSIGLLVNEFLSSFIGSEYDKSDNIFDEPYSQADKEFGGFGSSLSGVNDDFISDTVTDISGIFAQVTPNKPTNTPNNPTSGGTNESIDNVYSKKILLESIGNKQLFYLYLNYIDVDKLIAKTSEKCGLVKYINQKLNDEAEKFKEFLPQKSQMTTFINMLNKREFSYFIRNYESKPEHKIAVRMLLYAYYKYNIPINNVIKFADMMQNIQFEQEVIDFVRAFLNKKDRIIYDEIILCEEFYRKFIAK